MFGQGFSFTAKLVAVVSVFATVVFVIVARPDLFSRSMIAGGGQPVRDTSDLSARFLTQVTVAILRERAGSIDICTGVIVEPTGILTSSRCVADATKVSVLFVDSIDDADMDRFRESHRTNVKSISVHPWYKNSQDTAEYDLAHLRLTSPIPGDRSPVRYEGAFVVTEGDPLLAAGFPSVTWSGSSTLGVERSSLRYAFAPISSGYTSWHLEDETGSCWHNTGGPLFLVRKTGPQLVGVHQDGDCDASSGFSSLTNDAVLRWLRAEGR